MSDSSYHAWIVSLQPVDTPRARLVCFAHAGGSPSFFKSWLPSLPDDVAVDAAILPGRERRYGQTPVRDLQQAIDPLSKALGEFSPPTPTVLFGHSMGAEVAFEVCRRLEARGATSIKHVFVSSAEPKCAESRTRHQRHLLTDEELLHTLRKMGGVPDLVLDEPELLARLLPVVRADFEANDTWTPPTGRTIGADLTALAGRSETDLEALPRWERLCRGTFQMKRFDGGHFYLEVKRQEVLSLIVGALR